MNAPSPHRPIRWKVALAACFGTFLEWYDFLSFGVLAPLLGSLFFPADDPVASLLASLATFGVGMVVRPIGAALFGSLGDRRGRRRIFIVTIGLMGGATFAVGLLPTYGQAGVWAPVMLVALRMLQGLAMGGEIGGAAVYLTEHAPTRHRGAFTSVLQLMGPLGIMVATVQMTLLQSWLGDADFRAWGWRVPFLISALLLAMSIKGRLALHESPVFARLRDADVIAKTPLREALADPRTRGRMALLVCCISSGGSLLFFSSQIYAAVFLKTVAHMDALLVGRLTVVATAALFPLTIACGWLSDRIGRRPVMLSGLLLGALAILPVFVGLRAFGAADHAAPLIILGLLLIPVIAVALITGPQTATLAELFPARVRYSAVALPHNLAAGWIGGMSPFIVTLLGARLGDPLYGLIYPVVLLVIAFLIGWRFMPETRNTLLEE
jgi:MFS family permease